MKNAHGRHLKLLYPDDGPAAYVEALNRYRDLRDQHDQAGRRLEVLARQRADAQAQDWAALADAIRAGKAEPTDKAVAKIDAEVAATERRSEALGIAIEDAAADVDRVIAEVQDAWVKSLGDKAMKAASRYTEAVDEVERARAEMMQARAAQRWVLTWKPGKRFKPFVPALPLSAPSGDDYEMADVLAAMRKDANPPTPPQPGPHVPAHKQVWPGGQGFAYNVG